MRVFVVPLLALGIFAGGYSDEPTEGEMRQAFEETLEMQVRGALELVADVEGPLALEKIRQVGNDRFAITSFQKLGCTRVGGDAVYRCSFTVSVELVNGSLERHLNGRFSPASAGLAFTEEV